MQCIFPVFEIGKLLKRDPVPFGPFFAEAIQEIAVIYLVLLFKLRCSPVKLYVVVSEVNIWLCVFRLEKFNAAGSQLVHPVVCPAEQNGIMINNNPADQGLEGEGILTGKVFVEVVEFVRFTEPYPVFRIAANHICAGGSRQALERLFTDHIEMVFLLPCQQFGPTLLLVFEGEPVVSVPVPVEGTDDIGSWWQYTVEKGVRDKLLKEVVITVKALSCSHQ